MIIWN
jgi:malate dehydrogenase